MDLNLPWWAIPAGMLFLAVVFTGFIGGLALIQRRIPAGLLGQGYAGEDEASPPAPALDSPVLRRQAPAPLVAPGLATLAPGQWFALLRQAAPHVMIVGETGSGKSTVAAALLYARAVDERILVIDPHATPATWGGLRAVGVGRDYAAIEAAFVALECELTRRFTLASEGQPWGAALSIFVDEYPTIAANCKRVAPAFKALAREGRKVGMRLVVLTQDANVKTLGLEGEGLVRENFSRVLLGSFAIKEAPGLAGQPWAAALDHKGQIAVIDTACCQRFEGAAIDTRRLWLAPLAPAPASTATSDRWLSGELATLEAGETTTKPFRPNPPAETHVSPVATPQNAPSGRCETTSFQAVARLIRAGNLPETKTIESAFGVTAGSSQAYHEARAGVKAALAQLESGAGDGA